MTLNAATNRAKAAPSVGARIVSDVPVLIIEGSMDAAMGTPLGPNGHAEPAEFAGGAIPAYRPLGTRQVGVLAVADVGVSRRPEARRGLLVRRADAGDVRHAVLAHGGEMGAI
jgi:hypothetical protein